MVTTPKWAFDGILPAEGVSMLYGRTKGYKSFWAIDWAACLSLGRSWHGHKALRPGPVVYVAGEGASGMKDRLQAWEKQHGVRAKDFLLVPHRVRLWHDPEQQRAFINEIRAADVTPTLIVFDTLSTCLGGASENDNGHVREVLDAAGDVGAEWGAAVLLVHHTGKAETSRIARGGQALEDGCAMVSYVYGDGNLHAVLDCVKQKDAAPFDPIRRTAHLVALGKGKDKSLAFADDYKTGPRDPNKRRVSWLEIRNLLAGCGMPMSPKLVASALNMDNDTAQAGLGRAEKRGEVYQPDGNGAYTLRADYAQNGQNVGAM